MSLELFPGKHLFLDDFRIEELTAARRVLNPPVKHPENPVLRPREPWEEISLHLGHLLYDSGRGRFRVWYSSQAATVIGTRVLVKDNPPSKVRESHICYAESADAVDWERPAAGVTEQDRYPGNNIVVPSLRPPGRAFLGTLIDDPFESDPERRFKMMYLDQAGEGEVGGGLAPDARLRLHAHSPDGIHWTRYPWQPHHVARLFGVLAYLDETPCGRLDPDAPYILYGQRGSPWKTRQIGRRDSGDFLEWSGNRPVLESRLADDPPGLEFYHLEGAVVNQTYAGLHLGMLGAYHTDLRRRYDPARNDGLTECQLAWSRDSVRWERWDSPFVERGEPGSFDWGGVYCGYPAIAGDTLYFMYTGESGRHGKESRAHPRPGHPETGRLRLGRDQRLHAGNPRNPPPSLGRLRGLSQPAVGARRGNRAASERDRKGLRRVRRRGLRCDPGGRDQPHRHLGGRGGRALPRGQDGGAEVHHQPGGQAVLVYPETVRGTLTKWPQRLPEPGRAPQAGFRSGW